MFVDKEYFSVQHVQKDERAKREQPGVSLYNATYLSFSKTMLVDDIESLSNVYKQ